MDSLVKQHSEVLAVIHGRLEAAVLEVGMRWADRYPEPAKLAGQTFCTSVRQILLNMNEQEPLGGSSLTATDSASTSVEFVDGHGTRIRVRKWPSDRLHNRIRVVSVPPNKQHERAAEIAEQLELGHGDDEDIFGPLAPAKISYDLFILWWHDSEALGLEGAVLAAVHKPDDPSHVAILATTPLPTPVRLGQAGGSATPPDTTTEPMDDFDEFDNGESGTGTTPA